MNTTPLINNKEEFIDTAIAFFNTIFEPALNSSLGEIEIRIFPQNRPPRSYFFGSEKDASEMAYELCNQGVDVYFGVNPRIDRGGKKDNVKYLGSFHAEVDYGEEGHKKPSLYKSQDEALSAIQTFFLKPTIIIHSGGGFHCYWVLSNPLKVEDYGVETLESINKGLTLALGGDPGTQDISRVLRVPGTYNLKNTDNPRPVKIILISGNRYAFKDFAEFKGVKKERSSKASSLLVGPQQSNTADTSLENLPVSERTKFLIRTGNDGTYLSRSEADMAVLTALVNKGVSEERIKEIYLAYPIGEKYRTHNAPDQYLKHSIEKAKGSSNLTEEEMQDPLFISGAIHKKENGYQLKAIKFQEYMVRKYRIKILDQERAFFKYNGKCYEQTTDESLNNLCQNELKKFREYFTKSTLNEFIHYAIGDALVKSTKAQADQVNYLTLRNGLYKIDERILVPHSPDIFTTNLLPFDYTPSACCPRFLQFLEEIFVGDKDKINFVQEAVGYAFHKSMPTPAVFFLIGGGSNGKSVFINTITKLVGEENTANVSFNLLS